MGSQRHARYDQVQSRCLGPSFIGYGRLPLRHDDHQPVDAPALTSGFVWTSISVNKNNAGFIHRDAFNDGPSVLLAVGPDWAQNFNNFSEGLTAHLQCVDILQSRALKWKLNEWRKTRLYFINNQYR